MLVVLFSWMIAINGWTMLCFWQDKQWARMGARRVPEADLLLLAVVGGTPGAFAARHLFRHKTRKQPFSTRLMLVGVVQIGVTAGFAIPV